jgi:pimeloyl-ACP methyl ester carboxylesterase
MNVESGLIKADGANLYYEATGTGDVVVLIHGFTLDTRMWDDQFLPFAERFRVIRYDLRGFGRSDPPIGNPYSHARDLQALFDQLDIELAHLVGLSKGGAVALDFALTYPQRCRTLVLIDTVVHGYRWSGAGSDRNALVWQRAREAGIPAAKESWLAHPMFAPAQQQPAVAERLARIVADYSGWHFVNDNPEQGLEPPAAQRLAELNMPILALVGEQDTPDFRQMTELIEREAPLAHRIILPGVGHMANMEAPEAVNELVVQFITKNSEPISRFARRNA